MNESLLRISKYSQHYTKLISCGNTPHIWSANGQLAELWAWSSEFLLIAEDLKRAALLRQREKGEVF